MIINPSYTLSGKVSNASRHTIWHHFKDKTINEIATSILFKKEIFKNLTLHPTYLKKQTGIKFPLIHHYINSFDSLGWDHKRDCVVTVGIIQRVYFVFYNLMHYCLNGTIRFDERKDLVLLKILDLIDLETFHHEKEFLDISYKLRLKITKQLKINKDINYQIIARQIIQKIDAIHRCFTKLPLEERQKIFPGLPSFIACDFNDVLLQVRQDGLLLLHAPLFQSDQRTVKAAYMQNPASFRFAAKSLKDDIDFVKSLLSFSESAFFESSSRCQDHPEVISELLTKNGKLLLNMTEAKRKDKRNVMTSLQSSSFDFSVIDTFNSDKDVMLIAYAKGCPLKLINPSLNDNEEFVLGAIELRGWDVYNRASERVKTISSVKVAAYKKRFMKKSLHPDQIDLLKANCGDIFDDEEFILHFLKSDGNFFDLASKRLKRTKSVILQGIKTCPSIFHDVDIKLLDKAFVIEILSVSPTLFPYIDDRFKDDQDVYKTAIFQNIFNYYHLSKHHQNNSSLIKELILKDSHAINIVKLDKLSSDDALEILDTQGALLHLLPFRNSLTHIKVALKTAPHLIHSIKKEVLLENPELMRLYILYKIDKSMIQSGGSYYLPKPLDARFLDLDNNPEFTVEQEPWEDLIEGPESDMHQFVDSLNLESLIKAKFTLFSSQNLADRKSHMKQSLDILCQRLKDKQPFLGTPKSTDQEQLHLFYETLYFYLKRLTPVLKKDKTLFNERLQILEASHVCGGGLLSQLSELDRQLIVPPCHDLSHVIAFKLTKIAYKKLSIMSTGDYFHTVHKSNLLKWHFHEYIGGKKPTFDQLAHHEDEIDLTLLFFKLFNPKAIAKELCEEVTEDEIFYEKLNHHIKEVFIKEFASTKEADKAKEKATIEFIELLDELDLHKAYFSRLSPLMAKLSQEQRLQALSIFIRPGSKEIITRILEVTFQKKIDQESIHELLDRKQELMNFHKYISRLAFLAGIFSNDILQLSKKDLKIVFEQNFEIVQVEIIKTQFHKLYQDESGIINTQGMILILESLGFFEKFPFGPR